MKTILITILMLASSAFLTGEQLNIGDKAPKSDLKMTGTDGTETTLSELAKSGGICVIFSCNTCPYVVAWEDRYNELEELCNQYQVGFVLVNSNEAKRDGADSMAEMIEHAKEKTYNNFAYVEDTNHVLADAFGATKTPDVFLFDSNMTLVYKGAIDDDMKDKSNVKEAYLKNALTSMVSAEKIDPATTKAIGCSIKRKS